MEQAYTVVPYSPKVIAAKYKCDEYYEGSITIGGRFAIADGNGKILDDAQGYGYKSVQNATLALKWKYLGGKQKSAQRRTDFMNWKKASPVHDLIVREFHSLVENWVKELACGEITEKDIWTDLKERYQMDIPFFVKAEALKRY